MNLPGTIVWVFIRRKEDQESELIHSDGLGKNRFAKEIRNADQIHIQAHGNLNKFGTICPVQGR